MNPLEVLKLPMGIINYYYFQAWNKNQQAEKEREEEEKRRAKEEKGKKNNAGTANTKIHPAQGGRPFMLNNNMIEELQDELD